MPIARSWYHPMAIGQSIILRPRVYGAVLAGFLAYMVCSIFGIGAERLLISWDVGGLAYIALAFHLIANARADRIKTIAAKRDDSRVVILAIILLSICASFVAITLLVIQAKHAVEGEKAYLAALAMATIVISWCVTQLAFTLHYAHEYYMPDDGGDVRGGLDFPNCDLPDYWDFLYFATSIGATSQTSDTAVRSRSLRRLITIHAVIAFFFNTAVLALTVNVAASLA